MANSQFIEQLGQKITTLLPVAGEIGDDLRRNLRQLLQSSFTELNLLTREQFESQAQALSRAEQKIEELANQISELEAKAVQWEAESD